MQTEFQMIYRIVNLNDLTAVGRYSKALGGRIFVLFPDFKMEISEEVARKLIDELVKETKNDQTT